MLEAFAALEPGRTGRAELTRVAHERGWTGVRLDLPLALRFAPLLARVLERVVLVWTVDAGHCRVSLFESDGTVVEAARPDQLEGLVRAFRATQPGPDIEGRLELGGRLGSGTWLLPLCSACRTPCPGRRGLGGRRRPSGVSGGFGGSGGSGPRGTCSTSRPGSG